MEDTPMAEHTHHHDHSHGHSHDHDHEGDSYFIDQLCMVGLSGAFGMICLCLWFLQSNMLALMLGPQFHLYVLLSGFVLVTLAGIRGVILWNQSRDPNFKGDHDHAHHDHGHAHEHHHHEHAIASGAPTHSAVQTELPLAAHGASCGHDHAHGESCGHDHAHAHGHAVPHTHGHHHHHHDHDAADHDHNWAPWRYVVILVPIILFMLGLPNKPPSIVAGQGESIVAISPEAETYVRLTSLGEDPLSQVILLGSYANAAHYEDKNAQFVEKVDYKTLEGMANSAGLRADWKGKTIEVRGQYSPMNGSSQIFQLVRLKISCCANDAVQLNVPMVCSENITGIALSDWVKVQGRVDFRESNGAFRTVVIVSKAKNIEKCPPDTNPYIQ
jgi:hypothetical protein